jgi:dTDP-4-dehydrorhamnose reductase
MKVMVIGSNGQLGTDLVQAFTKVGGDVVPIEHRQLDVCNAVEVASAIASLSPRLVVNTAAFHKVEECEIQPQKAFEVNATGAVNLAKSCERHGATLVHFSTDYVFGGDKKMPYTESDAAAPLNVYGVSKLAGEHLVAQNTDRYFVIRTSGLYGIAGSSGKGGNFVETMLRKGRARESIRVVADQVLTPTYTSDLARLTADLATTAGYGLYHLSSEGECSWYEFARRIFELEQLDVDLTPVTTNEFSNQVRRPSYSVLSKDKAKTTGLRNIPFWEDALARYLHAKKNSLSAVAAR